MSAIPHYVRDDLLSNLSTIAAFGMTFFYCVRDDVLLTSSLTRHLERSVA